MCELHFWRESVICQLVVGLVSHVVQPRLIRAYFRCKGKRIVDSEVDVGVRVTQSTNDQGFYPFQIAN